MSIVRLFLAVFLGLVLGSVVNMALVMASGHVIPPPPGADMATAEGIREALPQLQARHFLFPFLAHALGTLVGAFMAAKAASQHKLVGALTVGALFLAGGIMAAFMIPAPPWFIATDLVCAYFPFAWLGYLLARPRMSPNNAIKPTPLSGTR
jgi:hypothetical protein